MLALCEQSRSENEECFFENYKVFCDRNQLQREVFSGRTWIKSCACNMPTNHLDLTWNFTTTWNLPFFLFFKKQKKYFSTPSPMLLLILTSQSSKLKTTRLCSQH